MNRLINKFGATHNTELEVPFNALMNEIDTQVAAFIRHNNLTPEEIIVVSHKVEQSVGCVCAEALLRKSIKMRDDERKAKALTQ